VTTHDTNAASPADAGGDAASGPAFAERLKTFIQDEVVADDDPIDGDTDLLLTGLVDSLGVVMIVEWIETELEIAIDPADVVLEHFQTIDAMVGFLRRA
jgi:acyl carrier protein